MKFQVAKQDLKLALDTVSSAMAGGGSDLSSHYTFRLPPGGDGSRMEVLAYNHGRLFAGCPFVAVATETDKGSSFTVEGNRINQLLNAVPESVLTLEFDPATKVVVVTTSRGTQQFQSLDPINFPYWDATITAAKQTCVLAADRFKSALDFARRFASDQDTSDPHLCVIEVKDGALAATDAKSAAVLVSVEGLKDSTLRVHVKDASAILEFLGTAKDTLVSLLEHDRALFIKRDDGAVFGETRFNVNFPVFNQPEVDDQHFWKLSVDDLKSGIQFLTSGSSKDDDRLTFTRPMADGPVMMTMNATTGKPIPVEVACPEFGDTAGAAALPAKFVMSCACLKKVLGLFSEENLRFGVNSLKKAGAGFTRFIDTKFADAEGKGGDQYRLFVMWMK